MVVQGAATSECKEPSLTLERPLYEEKMAAGNSTKVKYFDLLLFLLLLVIL